MTDYLFCESPLGQMLLTGNGDALSGVYFIGQKYLPPLEPSWREHPAHEVLAAGAHQLKEYFAGKRRRFELPLAPRGTPFQQSVWSAIAGVGYGERITYSDLAQRIGRPDCARAAGTATGRNPLSIIVPCHRIVGADGSLTGYAGGLERKRALLGLETIANPVPMFELTA